MALIVDDGRAVERSVARNAGDKTSALETIGQAETGTAIRMPETSLAIATAVERYAGRSRAKYGREHFLQPQRG